jgi:hypothetical protein
VSYRTAGRLPRPQVQALSNKWSWNQSWSRYFRLNPLGAGGWTEQAENLREARTGENENLDNGNCAPILGNSRRNGGSGESAGRAGTCGGERRAKTSQLLRREHSFPRALRILGDVLARIGAARAQAPPLRHVEHV